MLVSGFLLSGLPGGGPWWVNMGYQPGAGLFSRSRDTFLTARQQAFAELVRSLPGPYNNGSILETKFLFNTRNKLFLLVCLLIEWTPSAM